VTCLKRKRKNAEPQYYETVKKASGGLRRVFALSIILNLIDRFTNAVYKALEKGLIGRILMAYSSEEKAFERGFVKEYFVGLGGLDTKLHKLRLKFSEAVETSFFHGVLKKFFAALMSTSLKCYGNFLFFFGFYLIVIGIVRGIIPGLKAVGMDFFITDLSIMLLSFPLITSKQSLAKALGTGRITRLIVFDVCGYKDESFEISAKQSKLRTNVAVFTAMAAGLMTLVLPPIYVPMLIVSMLLLGMVISTPEIGVAVSIFITPFLVFFDGSSIMLAMLVLITAMSYGIKLIRGKRVFKLELLDLTVLLFIAVVFMSGVITAGGRLSFASALISCALMLGFFLTVNLIRSEKWINRCITAFASSAVIVAIIGILEYVLGFSKVAWLDTEYFSDIEGRVVSLFENPNVLGAYLAMAFPFIIAKRRKAETGKGKVLGAISELIVLCCAVLTWSRSAWLALILSTVLFLLINSRKTFKALIGFACLIPLVAYFMPRSIVRRFMSIGDLSDSSSYYRVYTWRGTIDAIREHLFGGVGYGTQAYAEIYPQYAYAGIEAAEHSHSLFLQILFEVGIFGFIIFAVILLLFTQKNYEYFKRGEDRSAVLYASAAFSAVVAALIYGLFDHLFYNYRILYIFWVIVALSSACIRYGENETRRKQVIEYSSSENASIDI